MEEKGFLPEKNRMGAWKAVATVTLVVAAALVVVVIVPTLLCQRGGDGNSTERLEKALDVTNRSLSLSLGRWQRCKEELVGVGDMGILVWGGVGDMGRGQRECHCVTLSGRAAGESLGAGAGAGQCHTAGG